MNHYHQPPRYSGEIALGSGFQCLTRYSALPTLPGCVGMYVWYVHPESFTHFLCIPTASAVKIQIQRCQWNNILFLKSVCVYVYAKLSYTTGCDFMLHCPMQRILFHLMPHPHRAAVGPWRAQPVPCSPSLQHFQYSYPTENNPNISDKTLLEVFSQCYHIVI